MNAPVQGELAGFVHRFVPPDAMAGPHSGTTLLLLHGTGGDEDDLIPLGRALAPGAALLSPRGSVLELGAPRFFRRLTEGVFDMEDLRVRTAELAEFIAEASDRYALESDNLVAVGFSNGANILASMLLRGQGGLRRAVLLSPMLPYEPADVADLHGTRVFIGAGAADPIAPAPQVDHLAQVLRSAGAEVALDWQPGGHSITTAEVEAARRWIGE